MKPLIKDTPKENKPPNKGQAESILVYILYRKSPLKEDNLSTKDKTAGPEGVLIKRFHMYYSRWLDNQLIQWKPLTFGTSHFYPLQRIVRLFPYYIHILFQIRGSFIRGSLYKFKKMQTLSHKFIATTHSPLTDKLQMEQTDA